MASDQPGSLQEKLNGISDLVDYFYNETPGPHSRTSGALSPVPAEHTNWRDEHRAWRETAILFDQSHHMPELFLRGPDAGKLLNYLGINSFKNFGPGRGKQFVGCNQQGQLIGECVLHDHGENGYELISGMPFLNWVEYNALTGGYDVEIERDAATSDNTTGRRVNFRFGMDGPNAGAIFNEVVEGGAPEIKFFRTAWVKIAGCDVFALRHGMAGHQGVEMSGRYEDGPKVREALLKAGEKLGLKQGGTRAYFSSALESGWVGYPLPAIYTAEDLRGFREWLPSDGWEAKFQLGGSFLADRIEDYYLTPYDFGYDRIIKFDHDFVGREALEAMQGKPRLNRVTLVWNPDDVLKIFRSYLEQGDPCKWLDWPVADYALPQRDEVRTKDGRLIGTSMHCGYSLNERTALSIASIEEAYLEPGTELILVWGEPNGGSRKPRVERHRQIEIRVTVAPVPYASSVQSMKRAAIAQ